MTRIILISYYSFRFVWLRLLGHNQLIYPLIYEAVSALGGVYVKLMQFLSLRANLFPDNEKLRFLAFYDQVPVHPLDVYQIIKQELGPRATRSFTQIETTPFASGTFGQVYRAILKDKTEVVIKIKRPHLKSQLFTDFIIIKFLGFCFNLFFYQRFIRIPKLIQEFQAMTYRELDYLAEVDNALFMYKAYQNHPVLKIPLTYSHLSTPNLIVQEYIDGLAVTDLLRYRSQGVDCNKLLQRDYHTDLGFLIKRFSYDSLWQIFTQDKFYSDPHPGNIKILSHNRYALVDFGIMSESPTNKRDYYQILKLLYQASDHFDAQDLSQQLLSIGTNYLYQCLNVYDQVLSSPDESLKQVVLNRYGEMIQKWHEQFHLLQKGRRENYTQVWLDLFTLGEQFDMHLPPGLFAGLRASALITSFTRYLDPNIQVMTEVYGNIARDIDVADLSNQTEYSAKHIGIEEAIEAITQWFSHLAEADLILYRKVLSLTN